MLELAKELVKELETLELEVLLMEPSPATPTFLNPNVSPNVSPNDSPEFCESKSSPRGMSTSSRGPSSGDESRKLPPIASDANLAVTSW